MLRDNDFDERFLIWLYKTTSVIKSCIKEFEKDKTPNANVIDQFLMAIEKLCVGKCHPDFAKLKSELILRILYYVVGGKTFDIKSKIKSAISTASKAAYYLNVRNTTFSFWRTKKIIKSSPHLCEDDKILFEAALDGIKRYFRLFVTHNL